MKGGIGGPSDCVLNFGRENFLPHKFHHTTHEESLYEAPR